MSKQLVPALVISTLIATLSGTALAAQAKGTIDPVSGKPCYQCHKSKVTGVKVHTALADHECTPCHANTGGDHQKNPALYAVKDKSANLCWQCHDSLAKQKSVHPIITDEGCLGCHAAHNSPFANLLKDKLPGLCFECHDKKLLNDAKTQKATGFRDGNQNLHQLHAKKNRIACLSCHDPHASSQEHLLRTKGMNGKESVAITYAATPAGGNCTVSCHDQLSYRRK